MENSKKNLEMIDRFIDNERKSKIWTTVNIVIFCLLGLAVFWLAFELNKSNLKYKDLNTKLQSANSERDSAVLKLRAYTETLRGDSTTLSNNAGNYDSLKKAFDTVTLLFNETLAKQNDMSGGAVDDRLNQYAKDIFNKDVTISSNIISKVATPVTATNMGHTNYKVFMHYMSGYDRISDMATKKLMQDKFNVPGQEQIKTISFNSVVKYFHDTDKEKAQEVANVVNKSNEYFTKNPISIQKTDLKSPSGQLEVWIGEYKKLNVEQIIIQQNQRQQVQQAKLLKKG
jgi:hypothetical protein